MSWYPSHERRGAILIVKTFKNDKAHIYLEKQYIKRGFLWVLFIDCNEVGTYKTESAGIEAWFRECEKYEGFKPGIQPELFLRCFPFQDSPIK